MSNAKDSIWTEALTADLVRLWSYGYSCAQIGAVIGVTRNSVIGKAHRLELPSHSYNVNGQKRSINPKPQGEPRRPGVRPRVCETVFKSRERMPGSKISNTKVTPGLVQVMSTLTGGLITVPRFRRQRAPDMTKSELRAMLCDAVQNTAAMGVP